jgi:hypothetical protein
MTNAEIARRRGVSVDAVKFHMANALAKLGLKDRKALRAWFRRGDSDVTADFHIGSIGQIARSVGDIKVSEQWYRRCWACRTFTPGTLAFDLAGTRLMLQGRRCGKESILYLCVTARRRTRS